ncbi:FHA domain-containing protein [Curtobacterium aurantiacum]|uniref:FHA domain-containing protein n=1 Tax=Curtobacterium aurantiacum TaxID=3236919 RepID=A0ABS5VJW8_9MICO|nr:FHA domain-containing protein [Curtobacterium flaccumfaciens]MBT1546649.1 FHA domain-containing protein [Curtobacterium flaccumfaciens pv. flaccumfaciens]MBT1589359.1 FHA domain-containing protein [Curtobacterium flaccumfaciens pv. flaccumfaciens]
MHDDDIEDTVIRRPRRSPAGDRTADAIGDTVVRGGTTPDPGLDGSALGDTVIRSGRGAGTHTAPGPRSVPGDDDPDDTVVRIPARPGAGPNPTVGAAPGLPSVPPVPSVPVAPAARVPSIRIGDRTFRLDHPVVIGRRPSLPRITRGPQPELVTVRSMGGQVSSSHVQLHAEGEAVVVQDLRSTNGTVVRPAGAPAYRMASGASIVALTGTVVEIGDGNAIEVLSPYLRVAPTAEGLPPVPPWPSDQTAHGTPRPTRERS